MHCDCEFKFDFGSFMSYFIINCAKKNYPKKKSGELFEWNAQRNPLVGILLLPQNFHAADTSTPGVASL